MRSRFTIGVIAGFSWFTLVFEAAGAESPGPDFSTLSRDSTTSSSSHGVILRLRDGSSVRVGGKLAALIAEGYAALRRNQYDRAISSFTSALQTNPDKSIASVLYDYRISAYFANGQVDKALIDCNAAIGLNAKDAAAYYNRAIIYGSKRNYKLAIRDSTTAIQLRPKFANAYHNRGAFQADISEFDKAIADLSEAIQFDPRSATTFDGRAQVYEDIEKFDKAMADYDRVLRIIPKDADDYVVRGRAYFKKGNYKEAASAFKKALQLSRNNDSALGGLAWLKATCPDASLRDGKEAIRVSMRACELSKWKEPYRIEALAAAHAETGDFEQAVNFQTQAINMKSEYGPVDKKTREHLALYRDNKPWRSKPLVAR
jgi:tetratricopeptide (TPR) repeat protein